MYLSSPNIKLPDDPDTIVWKYLDLSKFLDLLLSKKLFMSRSDKFEDQYEGTFSEPTYEEIKKLAADNPEFLNYYKTCLLYTSPSPRDATLSRMPSSA